MSTDKPASPPVTADELLEAQIDSLPASLVHESADRFEFGPVREETDDEYRARIMGVPSPLRDPAASKPPLDLRPSSELGQRLLEVGLSTLPDGWNRTPSSPQFMLLAASANMIAAAAGADRGPQLGAREAVKSAYRAVLALAGRVGTLATEGDSMAAAALAVQVLAAGDALIQLGDDPSPSPAAEGPDAAYDAGYASATRYKDTEIARLNAGITSALKVLSEARGDDHALAIAVTKVVKALAVLQHRAAPPGGHRPTPTPTPPDLVVPLMYAERKVGEAEVRWTPERRILAQISDAALMDDMNRGGVFEVSVGPHASGPVPAIYVQRQQMLMAAADREADNQLWSMERDPASPGRSRTFVVTLYAGGEQEARKVRVALGDLPALLQVEIGCEPAEAWRQAAELLEHMRLSFEGDPGITMAEEAGEG